MMDALPGSLSGADQFEDRCEDQLPGGALAQLDLVFILRLFRSIWRAALLFTLILTATVQGRLLHLFGVLEPGPAGAIFVHRWCRRFLRAIGVEYSVEGELVGAGGKVSPAEAVISNHLSYLDILVLSATRPFLMVAKTEVRKWPLLGWLISEAGTVFVTRGGGPATYPAVNAAMSDAFRSGLSVLFFPEGTTSDGSEVLPLRRGLFHSVLKEGVCVRAATLCYVAQADGPEPVSIGDEICWCGDAELVPHLFRLLGLKKIEARLRFGGVVQGVDRFELAHNGREALAEMYTSMRRG